MNADPGPPSAFSSTKLSFPPRLLRASAGSGKTFELSTRLIALLLAGENVERILATTFTRKAAAEILDRVILRLAKAGLSSEASTELGEFAGIDSLTPQRVLECLERVADQFNRINICTLDSWFFQIAQVFPLELGIDPGAGILDADERELLLSRAIGQMLTRLNPKDRTESILLLNRGAYTSRIVSKLLREIVPASAAFRHLPESIWNWIEVDESRRILLLEHARNGFAKIEAPRTKSKGNPPHKRWENALRKVRTELEHGRIIGLADETLVLRFIDGSLIFDKVPFPAESIPAFRTLCELVALDIESDLKNENSSAGKLMSAVYAELDLLLAGEKKIGFEELKLYLFRAALGDRAMEIYYRLDRRISHLLLDEFQDTSLFEWWILHPFVDEILSKSGEDTSFFCVGDVKQAIYSWRGGCSALFNEIKETWKQLTPEPRDLSYRSTRAVIETVNQVFCSVSDNPALADYRRAAAEWGGNFNPHSTSRTGDPGYAELRLIGMVDPGEPAKDQLFIAACNKIEQLHCANPTRSIGVLYRTNADVSKLLYYLTRRCPSIPASEEGGNPLTDSLPVTVMLSLLKVIDHPGDLISRFHVASSPLGSILNYTDFSDDPLTLELFGTLRREAYESGIGPLLSRLVQLLASTKSIPGYEHRRLERLVELGYQFDRRTVDRVFNFVSYVKRCKVADTADAPVRVMTIHGSKGLEFDSVILPDLDRSLVQLHKTRFLNDLPVGTSRSPRASAYRSANQLLFSPQLTEFFGGLADDTIESELCNLYVAMTRARDRLILLAPDRKEYRSSEKDKKNKRPTFDRILYHALAGPEQTSEPDRLVFSAGVISAGQVDSDLANVSDPLSSTGGEAGPAQQTEAIPVSPQIFRSFSHNTPSDRAADSSFKGNFARKTLEKGNLAAMSFGSLVHRGFEQIEWCEECPPSELELAQAISGAAAAPETEVKRAAAAVAGSLAAKEIKLLFCKQQFLNPGADRVEAFREQPFTFAAGQSIVSGSIDRLIVSFAAGKPVAAAVYDFKTDSIAAEPGPEEITRIRERYAPQISDYVTAAAHLTGLDPAQIQAALVLTSIDKVIPIETNSAG